MNKESDYFEFIVRAQLVVAKPRQDTYFANLKRDTDQFKHDQRVFVKGPYQSKEKAQVAINVNFIKNLAQPHLPVAKIELVELIPDLLTSALGFRNDVKLNTAYWFQIQEDLTGGEVNLPAKLATTKTAWKEPVPIVDWDKLGVNYGIFGKIVYSPAYEETLFAYDPNAAVQLVQHILIDYVIGCGGDLASRNFIYVAEGCKIYNVDTEHLGNMKWLLSSTQIASARTKSNSHIVKFINTWWHMLAPYLDDIAANLLGKPWLQLLPSDAKRDAVIRLGIINNREASSRSSTCL